MEQGETDDSLLKSFHYLAPAGVTRNSRMAPPSATAEERVSESSYSKRPNHAIESGSRRCREWGGALAQF